MPCLNHPSITDGLTACARCRNTFCPNCVVSIQGLPYCATCKAERLRDMQSGVPTGQLELASIWHRFCAQLVDGFVLLVPLGIIVVALLMGYYGLRFDDPEATAMAMQQLGVGAQFILAVPGLILGTLYEALMLAWRGQTLGKMALGIKVVSAEGRDLTTGQAWGRAGIRQLLALLSCCGILIDYLPAFFSPEKACVHDLAAKTRVVMAR